MAVYDNLINKLISGFNRQKSKTPAQSDKEIKQTAVIQSDVIEDDRRRRLALLTVREHDLFLLLLKGLTLKESAEQLSVKYSTVNTHMTSIYKKLGVNSRAEMIISYWNADKQNNQ